MTTADWLVTCSFKLLIFAAIAVTAAEVCSIFADSSLPISDSGAMASRMTITMFLIPAVKLLNRSAS